MAELTRTPRDEATTEPGGTPLPTRRSLLRAVAVTGAGAAVLAACGGGGGDEDGGGGATGTDQPGGASTGAGGPLVATADVPVGGGVVLDEQKIVVTQPTAGDFKAFTAVCTHQQCTVSGVKDNTITCPCHGSTYSAVDGSVEGGPAPRPLTEVPITVEGDEIVQS